MSASRVLVALLVTAFAVGISAWLGSPLFFDQTVDEDFALPSDAVIPADMTPADARKAMAAAAATDDHASDGMSEAMRAAGVVSSGRLRDGDSFHKGSGAATVYALPDGSHVLRLEDLRVTNGPDLRVLLSGHSDPPDRTAVMKYGSVDLGALRGNLGNQNYPIPDEVYADEQGSVVIYCRAFGVVFAVAPLTLAE